MKSTSTESNQYLKVAAVAFKQGDFSVYAFAVPGGMITQIADFSRLKKNDKGGLLGFQRKEIQQHVKQITDYLNDGPGLFPNAIILAMAPGESFELPRGPAKSDATPGARCGYLSLRIGNDDDKAAWIVDGQQRSLALAKSKRSDLLVPVIAFVAPSLELQRQQFILVNRAKPLSHQLINELLPETDAVFLPKAVAINKVPAQLCTTLHTNQNSPFYNRVSRQSVKGERKDLINDSAIILMIKDRINQPNGALAHLRGYSAGESDADAMYKILEAYWSAVAEVFPQAWALPPEKSRLTHSAGIRAMGTLLDRVSTRVDLQEKALKNAFKRELSPLAKTCAWTEGMWPYIKRPWNAIEVTTKGLTDLSRALNSLYMDSIRG